MTLLASAESRPVVAIVLLIVAISALRRPSHPVHRTIGLFIEAGVLLRTEATMLHHRPHLTAAPRTELTSMTMHDRRFIAEGAHMTPRRAAFEFAATLEAPLAGRIEPSEIIALEASIATTLKPSMALTHEAPGAAAWRAEA